MNRKRSKDEEGEIPEFIKKFMPDAIEDELLVAVDNVKRYLAVVMRIDERLNSENVASSAVLKRQDQDDIRRG